MDLEAFIATSLSQIISAVKVAQKQTSGENVAAEAYNIPPGQNLFSQGTDGMFTIVDFDVSVVAENKEGGQTLRVSEAERHDGTSTTQQNASRMRFSIHVRLPLGGAAPSSGRGSSVSEYDPFANT